MNYFRRNHFSVFVFSDGDLCYQPFLNPPMEEIDHLQENIIIDLRGITGLSRKGIRFLFSLIEGFRKANKEPRILGALWTLKFMEATGFRELTEIRLSPITGTENNNKVMDCEKNFLWDALSGE